jgi:hypothetical protein
VGASVLGGGVGTVRCDFVPPFSPEWSGGASAPFLILWVLRVESGVSSVIVIVGPVGARVVVHIFVGVIVCGDGVELCFCLAVSTLRGGPVGVSMCLDGGVVSILVRLALAAYVLTVEFLKNVP